MIGYNFAVRPSTPAAPIRAPPSHTTPDIQAFLAEHRIHRSGRCVISDMTGIARGKIPPRDLFLAAGEMRPPKSVLLNTVNGQQPDNGPFVGGPTRHGLRARRGHGAPSSRGPPSRWPW